MNDVKFPIVKVTDNKNNKSKENIKSARASNPFDGFSIELHKKQFEAIAEAIINDQSPPDSEKKV